MKLDPVSYETPLGTFRTYEEAHAACVRCDYDPVQCINIGRYYVYTPVDGERDNSTKTLEEAKQRALWRTQDLDICGCSASDTAAHVVDRETGEWVFSSSKEVAK